MAAARNLLKELVFLNRIQYPPLPRVPDLSDPSRFSWSQPEDEEEWSPTGVSHLFISSPAGTTDSTSRLGAWLMLPAGSSGRVEPLAPSDTVVLYLHGNAFNRSQQHRIELYRLLLSLGYYVLAVDYRGFGDSSPVDLSESSVVADARAAVAWLTSKLGDCARVVVWGHSLGTGVATHMVAEFDLETGGNSPVCGLVLESPFNNMLDEVATYKISSGLVSRFIDVRQLVTDTDVAFESDRWLPAVRCPVLILHAEDDGVVPHRLGVKLEEAARAAGKENVRLVSFPAALRLGHTVVRAPGLGQEVGQFVAGLEGSEERAARLA